MNKKSKFIKLLTAFSSLTLLSACLSSVTTPGMNDQVHRNSVQLVRFSHVIKAESDATNTLSQKTIADLNNFLNSTNVGYGDVLMVDTAYQATNDRVLEIKKYVQKRGHEYAGKTLLGGKPAAGDITLYVERHVVTTPNCGNWPDEPGSALINNPSSFNGCSNIANLGLMVADPRDLIAGQQGTTTTSTAVNAVNANSGSGTRTTRRRR
jgi:type IV pilus biogenesis protein CpaD/CtpE